jgi:hypothetical protein
MVNHVGRVPDHASDDSEDPNGSVEIAAGWESHRRHAVVIGLHEELKSRSPSQWCLTGEEILYHRYCRSAQDQARLPHVLVACARSECGSDDRVDRRVGLKDVAELIEDHRGHTIRTETDECPDGFIPPIKSKSANAKVLAQSTPEAFQLDGRGNASGLEVETTPLLRLSDEQGRLTDAATPVHDS